MWTGDGCYCEDCEAERVHKQRAVALVAARLEIDQLDNDIIDLLMRRMTKARYARYMHPGLDTDDARQHQIVVRYTKRLTPWISVDAVAALCDALFRMSMP